jgi:hypothetical protein
MDTVTIFAAIAAVSAAIAVASTIVGSSRSAATSERQSMGSVPPDPIDQEHGHTRRGPDMVRIVQLISMAVAAAALVVLVILLWF